MSPMPRSNNSPAGPDPGGWSAHPSQRYCYYMQTGNESKIGGTNYVPEEENNTKGDVVVQAKPNNGFSKINSKIKLNSEVGNADSGTKNQEIIFKVQIISSNTHLAKNSPRFNGLKNVWEYKDSGLYKYTVGNQKDLKSASALQSEFRRKGFRGAFVVAFKNGKRIPLREAQRLLN